MAQVTSGVRAVLSHPRVYSLFQSLMGAHKFRTNFVANFVRPFPGMKILDIGCGPADILDYLHNIDYWGFDISEHYIERATNNFGTRGHFYCKQLQVADLIELPKFDVVLAIGLLHHLDDQVAFKVLNLAYQALKPGGRLLTVDPCIEPSQNSIARFLVLHDRGQNVRYMNGYETLVLNIFNAPKAVVSHQAWIPYTHCIMECEK